MVFAEDRQIIAKTATKYCGGLRGNWRSSWRCSAPGRRRTPIDDYPLLALVSSGLVDLLSFERVVVQRQHTGPITGRADTGNPVSLSHAAGALRGANFHSDFKHLMFRTRQQFRQIRQCLHISLCKIFGGFLRQPYVVKMGSKIS